MKSQPFLLLCLCISAVFIFSFDAFAQTKKSKRKTPASKTQIVSNLPKITQIDETALSKLLKPSGKPLLVNFWATWCEPCREEFPDLVKLNADYKDKIDFVVVSLDELSEINRDVPKFLAEMKAAMPAYLLKTPGEDSAIAAISKDWQGALPFTILYSASGETVFTKQGKIQPDDLRAAIEKILAE